MYRCTLGRIWYPSPTKKKNATISARETNRTKKPMSTTAQTHWQSSAEIWEGQRNYSLKNEVHKDANSCFTIRKDWRFAVRAKSFALHWRSRGFFGVTCAVVRKVYWPTNRAATAGLYLPSSHEGAAVASKQAGKVHDNCNRTDVPPAAPLHMRNALFPKATPTLNQLDAPLYLNPTNQSLRKTPLKPVARPHCHLTKNEQKNAKKAKAEHRNEKPCGQKTPWKTFACRKDN